METTNVKDRKRNGEIFAVAFCTVCGWQSIEFTDRAVAQAAAYAHRCEEATR